VVASSSIVGIVFVVRQKLILNRGQLRCFCFHHVVNGINNHNGGFDQWETKNCIHTHLESGSDDKGCLASFLHRVGQVELESHSKISCDGP
jgi:hypothetical protein